MEMKKCKIGKSGVETSVISLGTWSMGGDAQWGLQDDDSSRSAIAYALEHGINHIDTAPAYGFGHSEELVGEVLKNFRREDIVIETKCGVWWKDDQGTPILTRDGYTIRRNLSRKAMLEEIDLSLKRLGLDYIDIYVTHQQPMPPFNVEISEIMETLAEIKKSGKIRAVGISNATEEQLREYISYGQIDIVQERFSMLDQKKMRAFAPILAQNGITAQCYSPLEQGLLTGKLRMDYTVPEGNVRKKITWFEPEKRRHVLDMLDGWSQLCEKYNCPLVSLVIAWTAASFESANVICGGRKEKHLEDYILGGVLDVAKEDLAKMDADIASATSEAQA